jgi:hypothetical protein
MRQCVYISGPLTSSGNVLENMQRAIHAARALIAAGFAPFCPHLSYHVDPADEIPHAVWMDVDLAWLAVADAMLVLPGESRGVEIELDFAKTQGIPIFRSVAALAEHFQGAEV